MYAEALAWLETSGLGQAARHSGALFAAVNVLHVLGAALLVGGIAVFDLKVLARGAGAQAVGRVAVPLAAAGLLLQAPTGLTLLAVEARALGVNPAFLWKLAFIALGLVNLAAFHVLFGDALRSGGPLPPLARWLAVVSLAAWTMTLIAGRMIAYV